MTEWQPIDRAPRGGQWMLLWWPGITDCAVVGYRSREGWRCQIGSYDGYLEGEDYGAPSHWMPLPRPPSPQFEAQIEK